MRRAKYLEYQVIYEMSHRFPITLLCEIAGVSRSGYYKWIKNRQTPSKKQVEDQSLQEKIMEVFSQYRGIFGYRRMTVWLRKTIKKPINHKRIYRLMKELGIQARIRKKRIFHGKREVCVVSKNYLNRGFQAARPNEKWVTDVTILPFNKQRLYLSVIYDLYNNEVVSYKISRVNNLQLVLDTLDAACKKRPVKDILLHSDQGVQYTSRAYHHALKTYGMKASMSRKGNCLDNACIESFFGHLKAECFYLLTFNNIFEIEQAIHKYIEFYNTSRCQKKLHNLSPVEYRVKAM
ncbi:IS3 family transposase [Domibacillus indicus]|uniref:IS3 family transposase n=1 Tax=Domibacillus indicus TaxID=1437523 RepID=UPI00204220A2|nr:IS3 family transposase [Domibacillus indicus]MCM3791624.1 IS3 family transposase [Domibacillus indicus]